MSSPRAWGCFRFFISRPEADGVFPTCVGVFLADLTTYEGLKGLPHVRGGVSSHFLLLFWFLLSSPRAWGCFFVRHSR